MGAMGSPRQRSRRPNLDPEVNDLGVNVKANKELWFQWVLETSEQRGWASSLMLITKLKGNWRSSFSRSHDEDTRVLKP